MLLGGGLSRKAEISPHTWETMKGLWVTRDISNNPLRQQLRQQQAVRRGLIEELLLLPDIQLAGCRSTPRLQGSGAYECLCLLKTGQARL